MSTYSEAIAMTSPSIIKGVSYRAIHVPTDQTVTPLQVVCFFEQTKNRTISGGTALINNGFEGALSSIRFKDYFHGYAGELLVLDGDVAAIQANKILLVGLGDPSLYDEVVMKRVARAIIFQTKALDVAGFCFAPSIIDAGVTDVKGNVLETSLRSFVETIDILYYMENCGLINSVPLREITFLAGSEHIDGAIETVSRVAASYAKSNEFHDD